MVFDEAIVKRFWSKVAKRGPNDCWEWQGYIRPNGYGSYNCTLGMGFAHRYAFMFANAAKLTSRYECVCHTCDNRRCCNPAHLWLGTHKDNIQDMLRKGRQRKKGGPAPRAKLSESQVSYIKLLLRHKYRHEDIAVWYCVSKATIAAISFGSVWRNIPTAEVKYAAISTETLSSWRVVLKPIRQVSGVASHHLRCQVPAGEAGKPAHHGL